MKKTNVYPTPKKGSLSDTHTDYTASSKARGPKMGSMQEKTILFGVVFFLVFLLVFAFFAGFLGYL